MSGAHYDTGRLLLETGYFLLLEDGFSTLILVGHVTGSPRTYGTHYYGEGLYGADGLQWWLEIDWNGDGGFEANESARIIDVTIERGRPRLFSDNGIERDSVGTATIIFDNYDNRYSPWYTASPLYPNVLPNRQAVLKVVGIDGTIYPLLRGVIDEPQTYNMADGRCKLTIKDGWALLDTVDVALALQANVGTDVVIGLVLDAAAWPSAYGRALDTASDTLAYWWVNSRARDAIAGVTDSEFGTVYIANSGAFTFKSRGSLNTQASTLTLTQDKIRKDNLTLGSPTDTVKNSISVKVHPINTIASGVIWKLWDQPAIASGASVTFIAEYTYNNHAVAAASVLTPVVGTDYTFGTALGGSDLNAQLTITVTALSQTALIVVTNNGPSAGYLSLLQLKGQALDQPDTAAATSSDATSITAYGKRQLTLDLPWQQTVLVGQGLADWLKVWLKTATTAPRVTIENWPSIQFGYDRGARITLSLTAIGLNADFRIGRVQHAWKNRSAQAPVTTWTLEPVDMGIYWQLGTAGRSELGVTTKLGY